MEKIVPPIQIQDHGSAVANFQEALLFIIEKRQLTPNNLSLAEWKQAGQSNGVKSQHVTFSRFCEQLHQNRSTQKELKMSRPYLYHYAASFSRSHELSQV